MTREEHTNFWAVEYGDAIGTRKLDPLKIGCGRIIFSARGAAERFQANHGPEMGCVREVVINAEGCIDWQLTERLASNVLGGF